MQLILGLYKTWTFCSCSLPEWGPLSLGPFLHGRLSGQSNRFVERSACQKARTSGTGSSWQRNAVIWDTRKWLSNQHISRKNSNSSPFWNLYYLILALYCPSRRAQGALYWLPYIVLRTMYKNCLCVNILTKTCRCVLLYAICLQPCWLWHVMQVLLPNFFHRNSGGRSASLFSSPATLECWDAQAFSCLLPSSSSERCTQRRIPGSPPLGMPWLNFRIAGGGVLGCSSWEPSTSAMACSAHSTSMHAFFLRLLRWDPLLSSKRVGRRLNLSWIRDQNSGHQNRQAQGIV